MIQVLEKAVNILDYLSQNSTREVPLSELADSLGINRPTCANIMKSLKDLALVEQTDYRGGYILGDKVYSLSGSNTNYQKVVRLIKPYVDKLSHDVNEDIVFSTIRGNRRIILYKVGANHTIVARLVDDMKVWQATTARVIIAQYKPEKLNNYIKMVGLPGSEWAEVHNRQELLAKLAEYRSQACTTVINRSHFACLAVPVFSKGEVLGSLACYLPDIRLGDGRKELIEEGLIRTTQKINKLLA